MTSSTLGLPKGEVVISSDADADADADNLQEPAPTSSLLGEGSFHGRDGDRYVLVQFLLLGAEEEGNVSVIPILGAAGVGKTALLQHVYNDADVSQRFNVKVWVSASGGRPMIELMNSMAESLTGVPCNYSQLGVVRDLLKRKTEGRRFLLVLDDVCYETIDGGQWEELRATFHGCADGSVITLTTRDERVADKTGTVPSYFLESSVADDLKRLEISYGRDDDRNILVTFLLDAAMEDRLSVVPIEGAAGVGKTTLLQHIYKDPVVSQHFNLMAWVSSSGGQQMTGLMKAITESLIGSPCNYNQSEEVLQDLLKRKIDGHRLLLALDDVCYETIQGDQWEELCATFNGCASGSVIILTTQDQRVADKTGTVPSYFLEPLPGDH